MDLLTSLGLTRPPGFQAARDAASSSAATGTTTATGEGEPQRMRVDLVNRSGFRLVRTEFLIQDSEHAVYESVPPASMADKGFAMVVARARDGAKTDLAGDAVYMISNGDNRTFARVTWRLGASPVGTLTPNDGRFIVRAPRKGDDRFQYVVEAHQGPPPEPDPPMQITIDNRSGRTLILDKSALDNPKAAFAPGPPSTIDGDQKGQFAAASADPEFPKTRGDASYCLQIDPPLADKPSGEYTLNIGWDDDGMTLGNIAPDSPELKLDFDGDDRNPVFIFRGPPLVFKPPGKASEPTLRVGDKSADGWVEYLQELLNLKGAKLEVDGDFQGETLKAVKAFQRKFKKQGVLEDGIVGDQTWSYLREGAPAKPHGDGRKPHTFVEKGNSARWVLEKRMPIHDPAADAMLVQAVSVGDVDQIAKRAVRFRVVSPSGAQKVFERPIGPGLASSKTGQGDRHNIVVTDFSTIFGPAAQKGQPAPGDYQMTAYFPANLGGDTFEGTLSIGAA